MNQGSPGLSTIQLFATARRRLFSLVHELFYSTVQVNTSLASPYATEDLQLCPRSAIALILLKPTFAPRSSRILAPIFPRHIKLLLLNSSCLCRIAASPSDGSPCPDAVPISLSTGLPLESGFSRQPHISVPQFVAYFFFSQPPPYCIKKYPSSSPSQ